MAALLVENVPCPPGVEIRCEDDRFLNPTPSQLGGDLGL